jgi:histidine triad (HIT) family protein
MASIFSKIISGEIACHKIAENDKFIAFLDAFPLQKGHTLVVPKAEIDYVFDLTDEMLSDMMLFAKPVAKAIGRSVDCKKVGIAVIGLEVPHCHLHLCPINSISDMDFTGKKLSLLNEEMQSIALSIRNNL